MTNIDNYKRITGAYLGTTASAWSFNSSSNLLSTISATGVQGYSFAFDVNTGNLNSRTNSLKSKTETCGYDADKLDRLTTITGPANLSIGYTIDKNGNIQAKSDAGTYTYNNTPYAVDQITGGLNISNDQQDIQYYSFEKVKKITEGTKIADFDYNADHQPIRMVLKDNGTETKTRYYFGGSCEREVVAGVTTQYLWIGGDAYTAVAVAKKVGTGNWNVYNIFRDHLGTITHLKNGTNPADEYSFDAWGRRRDKDDWTTTLTSEPALFADRGFTGHEYLEDFKLYNMNGRLYDPVVGRFLSADPYVQDGGFTQSYNRYSYCLNNPLRYTDPSGNTWWSHLTNWTNERFDKLGGWMNENNIHINYNASYNPGTNHFFIPQMYPQMPTWDVPYTLVEQRAYAGGYDDKVYKGSIWKRVPAGQGQGDGYGDTFGERLMNLPRAMWNGDISGMDPNINYIEVGLHTGPISWITPGGGQIRTTRAILSSWKNVNWKSVASTVKYHYSKHVLKTGVNKNLIQYTDDALNFFNSNKNIGQDIMLKDGSLGLRIRLGSGQPGGIFTPDGKIVSFWYY